MSTHSAECCPYTCPDVQTLRSELQRRAPSTNAAYGRTMIRKTSLLRKINPMMRRSSFTNKGHLQLDHLAMNERRNVPEIVDGIGELLRRSQTRINLLFTMYEIPHTRPVGHDMRSDVSRTTLTTKRFLNDIISGDQTIWWSQTGSNRRPHACKARALPAELWPRNQKTNAHSMKMGGRGRLELPTSRLSSARSNQLSYKPLTHIQSRTRDLQGCSPSAFSSAKKEKRRRRNPANAAQRS